MVQSPMFSQYLGSPRILKFGAIITTIIILPVVDQPETTPHRSPVWVYHGAVVQVLEHAVQLVPRDRIVPVIKEMPHNLAVQEIVMKVTMPSVARRAVEGVVGSIDR